MVLWETQLDALIAPAVARSAAIRKVHLASGAIGRTGEVAASVSPSRRALVMADEAGFGAAGAQTVAALESAGFEVRMIVKPSVPLPAASVEEAEAFRAALAENADIFPVSVGSGVINDLVKHAAFETGRRYLAVATAASMDGYASAGASLACDGFKITVPARAPVAIVADLDVISEAPAEMNGWGYGDLAGKVPAGGDWILADLVGAEPLDGIAWGIVQDGLRGWLNGSDGIARGDRDAVAGLFVGLTAAGFAMEAHGSSRPASGAEHQIAHLWEMHGKRFCGRKIAHGEAVAVSTVAVLALFDWLLEQDIAALCPADVASHAPNLACREAALGRSIADTAVAERSLTELRAKHVDTMVHGARLERMISGWNETRERLAAHLLRQDEMVGILRRAGAPAYSIDIGITLADLLATMRAAGYIRRRYTILDFLHETGLTEAAFDAVAPHLAGDAALEASA